MIPFRTTAPSAAMPTVTMTLIFVNVAVFLYQIGLTPRAEMAFLYRFALVPAVYANPDLARQAGLDPYNYWPLITNTFMHGGFLHLILNMWTLWLFGIAVEGRLSALRFLLFYLACGAVGSLGHLLFNLSSTVPALGASGAIAGVLGGYARLFPRAKVTLVFPIIIFPLIFSVPAVAYTAVWFALQVYRGTTTLGLGAAVGGGIAWWAHIGGFLAGLILVGVLARPGPPRPEPALPSGLRLRQGPWSRRGPWG
jgi:membrane associated rhomboid family serine protease